LIKEANPKKTTVVGVSASQTQLTRGLWDFSRVHKIGKLLISNSQKSLGTQGIFLYIIEGTNHLIKWW